MQVVDGGLTLEEWFAGWEGENLGVGVDVYFTTSGGKVLNPRAEYGVLQVWDPQVLGIWSSRARGSWGVGW